MPIWTELSACGVKLSPPVIYLSAPLLRLLLDFGLPIFAFDSPSNRAKVEGVAHLPSLPLPPLRRGVRVSADVYTYKVLLEPNSRPRPPTHSLTCIQLPRSFISLCNLRYTSPARPSSPSSEPASDEVVARRISYKHESGLGEKWEISRRATAAALLFPGMYSVPRLIYRRKNRRRRRV